MTAITTETKTEKAADQKSAASPVAITDETASIGVRLRTQRESLGLTAEDIAGSLKIPAKKIKAIEAEQWETLPTGPYLKGFLRSYAKALRIDPQQLIEQIDSSLMQSRSPDTILRMPQSFETPLPRPSIDAGDWKNGRRMIYLGLALLVVIGLIIWSGTASFSDLRSRLDAMISSDTQANAQKPLETASPASPVEPAVAAGAETVTTTLETPGLQAAATPANGNSSVDVPGQATPSSALAATQATSIAAPSTLATSTSATSTSATINQENTTVPVPGSVPLVLNFSADTWVEIKQADGKILMSRINPANASVTLDVVPPADINIGNAAGIKLQYRNAPFDLSPYVRENIARLTLK